MHSGEPAFFLQANVKWDTYAKCNPQTDYRDIFPYMDNRECVNAMDQTSGITANANACDGVRQDLPIDVGRPR